MFMRRWLFRLLIFLGLGLGTTLLICGLLGMLLDSSLGAASSSSAFSGEEQWSVTRYDRAGAVSIHSVRARGLNWSPQMAAGPPDTPGMGDQTSAWASLTQDGQAEWLVLDYAKAVIPRRVDVYENYCPGALVKVSVFDAAGVEHVAWEGKDPTPAASSGGVPATPIPITLNVPTKRVKIYLDSVNTKGWNEIDAVGLVSDKDEIQWARQVTASSTYAASSAGYGGVGGNPALLVPGWSGLRTVGAAMAAGDAAREDRQVEARGWPMLAMYSATDLMTAKAGAATAAGGQGPPPAYSSTIYVPTPAVGAGARVIPTRPIWGGLAVNTVLFGVAWGVLWMVLVIPRRFFREVGRMRRGGCVRCGYDLGYDFVRGCPECGWRRDGAGAPAREDSEIVNRN